MDIESFFKELRKLKINVNISFHQDTVINGPRSGLTYKDFEDLYALYPKKMGKAAGLLRCHAQIKNQGDLLLAHLAIENYRAYVKKSISDPRYIFQFDTFMNNRWRDWIKPEKTDIKLKSEEEIYLAQMVEELNDK